MACLGCYDWALSAHNMQSKVVFENVWAPCSEQGCLWNVWAPCSEQGSCLGNVWTLFPELVLRLHPSYNISEHKPLYKYGL